MLFNFLRRRKPIIQDDLSPRQRELLARELAESASSAMPSDTSSDTFGDGSFINNISRAQATLNQRGMGGITARRIFEPRKGWSKNDKNEI